jgi:hypothetical protein
MTQFDVTAMAVDPHDGSITGVVRVERIDTEANPLFEGHRGPWEVEDGYLAYWNRLNPSWKFGLPGNHDKVVVLNVKEVSAP